MLADFTIKSSLEIIYYYIDEIIIVNAYFSEINVMLLIQINIKRENVIEVNLLYLT